MLNIGPRLSCAAGMVRKHRKTVDIGTDHAYIPAYLILNGMSDNVLACDIGKKPLENAAKTLREYSLENRIELRISDGLREVSCDEAEEIIICGMGGTLMSDILSAADWIKKGGTHLILQPMTHSEDVRRYLCCNGFLITEEKCVVDTGRVYCCISADYDGETRDVPEGYYYFGELPKHDEASELYVERQLHRVTTKLDALKKAGTDLRQVQKLSLVYDYYRERCAR